MIVAWAFCDPIRYQVYTEEDQQACAREQLITFQERTSDQVLLRLDGGAPVNIGASRFLALGRSESRSFQRPTPGASSPRRSRSPQRAMSRCSGLHGGT